MIPRKKERPVVNNRTADGASKLVALELISPLVFGRDSGPVRQTRRQGGKEVPGVENRIAQELKRIAVEFIGAGLRNNVDDGPRVLPVLGGVIAGLNAEFLERIREWKRLVDIRVLINVVAAIQLVADLVLPRAVGRNRQRPAFAGAPAGARR